MQQVTHVVVVIEAILFDLDETLHSREQAFWRWIADEIRNAGGPTVDRTEVERLDARGRGEKRPLLQLLDQTFHWGLSEAARIERFRAGIAKHLEIDVRVRDMLHRLGKAYRLGLVTNGTSATQRRKIEKLHLEDMFEAVAISEEMGFKKPDPRAFHHALARLRTAPGEAIFVGDDPVSDIAGAQAVGMIAVQVGGEGAIGHVLELEGWLETYLLSHAPQSG